MKRLGNGITIHKKIGVGGMGSVFEATLAGPGGFSKRVAVKIPLPNFCETTEAKSNFLREAQVMAKLSHPNVAQVFQVAEHDGVPFIVMEFVEGLTVKQVIEMAGGLGEFLPIEFIVSIATQIARGLEHAHSQGVIHRDLSPHNIMIDRQGIVKILDFGISKILAGTDEMTRSNTVRGKYAYISPEVVLGLGADKSADVFSFGTILFELLYNVNPFKGDSDAETIDRVKNVRLPEISDLRKGIPSSLITIVQNCLNKTPSKRPQSFAILIAELSGLSNYSQEQILGFIKRLGAKSQSGDKTLNDQPRIKMVKPLSRSKQVMRWVSASFILASALWMAPRFLSHAKLKTDSNPTAIESSKGLSCCRVCHKGKACGDGCIPLNNTCHKPKGCACDDAHMTKNGTGK